MAKGHPPLLAFRRSKAEREREYTLTCPVINMKHGRLKLARCWLKRSEEPQP